MRETHLGRLSDTEIGIDHSLYLHYKFYHDDLFRQFKSFAKGKLIDIGCGNKPYERVLAPLISTYVGCDIIQSNDNRVDMICPANNITADTASYDTVISTQTMEHVEDPRGLVSEAYRLLKDDGYFILSAPQYWPLHEEPYDFFRYTRHGFRFLLENAGFQVVSIDANGGKWSVAGQALMHAIFPTLFNIKGFKGKLIKAIAVSLGDIKTINRFFYYMDQKNPDYSNTMNYVVVAQKAQGITDLPAKPFASIGNK